MINAIINAIERRTGATLDYLRVTAKNSKSAFCKLLLLMPLASHRKRLPRQLWHTARIVATQRDDCGACVQITVNMAAQDGVAPHFIRSVLNRDVAKLDPEAVQMIRLVEASIDGAEDVAEPIRRAFVQRYGEAAIVELALAVATSRVFPTIKKVLGLAKSCSLVRIEIQGES